MSSPKSTRPAGGSATSGGIEYQARVSAWVATVILAQGDSSPPWGLPEDCRLVSIWGETGQPVDDLLVNTSHGGFAFLQVKRRLDLGSSSNSEFASALRQVVRQFLRQRFERSDKPWERPLDPSRDRLVLVVGPESSVPIRVHLPKILDRLAIASSSLMDPTYSQAEEDALANFLAIVKSSWKDIRFRPPMDSEVSDLARLLRLQVLDVEAGGKSEEESKERLRRLLAQPDQAGAAWALLVADALRLSSHRSGADFQSLRRLLRKNIVSIGVSAPKDQLFGYADFHEATKAALRVQTQQLSFEKYSPSLFVERRQLDQLAGLLDSSFYFRPRATLLLDRLKVIALRYRLDLSFADFRGGEEITPERVSALIPRLKEEFYFAAIETAVYLAMNAPRRQKDADFQSDAKQIMEAIAGIPFLDRLILPEIHEELVQARRNFFSGGKFEFKYLWNFLPGDGMKAEGLTNTLIQKLEELAELSGRYCAAVVGRAGHGKSNLLCSLAESLSDNFPVLLLTGQITISNEYQIEYHLQRWLERGLGRDCSSWLGKIGEVLASESSWLFVLIDGINENADPSFMSRALESFSLRSRHQRIKIIVSCRDLYWPIFERRLKSYLYGGGPALLEEFSKSEYKVATAVYFDHFRLRCRLSPEAETVLRNPLLLRLFCYTHRNSDLGDIRDLRAVDVFAKFVGQSMSQIADMAGLANTALVENFLDLVGNTMWKLRKASLKPSEIGVSPHDQSQPHSMFNQVRSEGLLVDGPVDPAAAGMSLDRPVQFSHEPFAEFVIASAWRREMLNEAWDTGDISRFLNRAIDTLGHFSPTLGAILFFARMSDNKSVALIQEFLGMLAKRGDSFLTLQQPAVLAAIEALPAAEIGEPMLEFLLHFEALASAESKDAMASSTLRLLREKRDHPLVRQLAFRLLEVDPLLLASGPKKSATNPSRVPSHDTPLSGLQRLKSPPPHSSKRDEELSVLPPARHHYSQETRLSALSILMSSDSEGVELFLRSARKLGNQSLHRALEAFKSLDENASDSVILPIVEDQIGYSTPEYRIYCAWLLRTRYGPRPAQILFKLLVDQQSRVQRYVCRIFQERLVEVDLIETILDYLEETRDVPSWHLVPLLELLSNGDRFRPAELSATLGRRVDSTLHGATRDPSPIVRKAAYKGLLANTREIERRALAQEISADPSPMVRALCRSPY